MSPETQAYFDDVLNRWKGPQVLAKVKAIKTFLDVYPQFDLLYNKLYTSRYGSKVEAFLIDEEYTGKFDFACVRAKFTKGTVSLKWFRKSDRIWVSLEQISAADCIIQDHLAKRQKDAAGEW